MKGEKAALDTLKHFPVTGSKEVLSSLLRDYELYRRTIELPGDTVVAGECIAVPLLNLANFSEAQTVGDRTRMISGFDESSPRRIKEPFRDARDYDGQLSTALKMYDRDRFVPWKERVRLVSGDLVSSCECFVRENPGLKISLLYLWNMDARTCRKLRGLLRPLLVRGGVVARR